MNIIFEKMGNKHQKQVMDIFNYYISNGTAAFPGTELPEQFYRFLLVLYNHQHQHCHNEFVLILTKLKNMKINYPVLMFFPTFSHYFLLC